MLNIDQPSEIIKPSIPSQLFYGSLMALHFSSDCPKYASFPFFVQGLFSPICYLPFMYTYHQYSSMSSFFNCPHCEIFAEFPSYLVFYIFASIILFSARIDDLFFIRKELIYIITIQVIGTILSFILNIMIIYCPQWDVDDLIFKAILPAFLGCNVSAGIMYFGVHWVIKQNVARNQRQKLYQFHRATDDNDHNTIPLREVLTDNTALDLFMLHLVRYTPLSISSCFISEKHIKYLSMT